MGIKIGRVGVEIATNSPSSWQQSGDQLQISGMLYNATDADAKALRHQMLGYENNTDEPIVPVLASHDSGWDGFYRVGSMTCETLIAGSLDGGNMFPFSMALTRVPTWSAPLFESRIIGALRVNSNSITTSNTRPFHGLPDAIENYSDYFSGQAKNTFALSDGTTCRYYNGGTGVGRNHYHDATPTYFLDAANFYDGACTIKVGSQTMVGRHSPNTPSDFEISNGICRVTEGANAGEMLFGFYNGTAWEEKDYNIGWMDSGGTTWTDLDVAPDTITILRNTVESASIRLSFTGPVAGITLDWAYTVDLTIRRGSRIVECFCATGENLFIRWGVTRSTVEAGAAITGGMEASAADGGNNKYVIATPTGHTAGTTNGRVYRAGAATTWPFAISSEIDNAASPFNSQTLAYSYHSAIGERMMLAAR